MVTVGRSVVDQIRGIKMNGCTEDVDIQWGEAHPITR